VLSGDLNPIQDMALGIEVIESNAFYHSNMDENLVPAAGLEANYSRLRQDHRRSESA
jgi:hypothetical protein